MMQISNLSGSTMDHTSSQVCSLRLTCVRASMLFCRLSSTSPSQLMYCLNMFFVRHHLCSGVAPEMFFSPSRTELIGQISSQALIHSFCTKVHRVPLSRSSTSSACIISFFSVPLFHFHYPLSLSVMLCVLISFPYSLLLTPLTPSYRLLFRVLEQCRSALHNSNGVSRECSHRFS